VINSYLMIDHSIYSKTPRQLLNFPTVDLSLLFRGTAKLGAGYLLIPLRDRNGAAYSAAASASEKGWMFQGIEQWDWRGGDADY
jgi:hypothetical protein